MPDDPTAPDAEWKKIQQNTFTRWCNEHLKCVNQYIYTLESDLCDGLKLISLLQVLSHKRIARYNKKPTFAPQKRENVAIALKFIETEDIKLVNIGEFVILFSRLIPPKQSERKYISPKAKQKLFLRIEDNWSSLMIMSINMTSIKKRYSLRNS